MQYHQVMDLIFNRVDIIQNLLKNSFFFFFFVLLLVNTSSEEDLILKNFKHGFVYYICSINIYLLLCVER